MEQPAVSPLTTEFDFSTFTVLHFFLDVHDVVGERRTLGSVVFLRFDDSHTEFRRLVYDQVDQAAKRNVDEILVIAFSQVDLLLAVRPAGADIDGVMPSFVRANYG